MAFHRRLMRSRFQPNEAYFRDLAGSLDLDASRLLADMQHPSVDLALTRSAALAATFRLPGTPAMIIGRRLVIGRVSAPELARLIDNEASNPSRCA